MIRPPNDREIIFGTVRAVLYKGPGGAPASGATTSLEACVAAARGILGQERRELLILDSKAPAMAARSQVPGADSDAPQFQKFVPWHGTAYPSLAPQRRAFFGC